MDLEYAHVVVQAARLRYVRTSSLRSFYRDFIDFRHSELTSIFPHANFKANAAHLIIEFLFNKNSNEYKLQQIL